MSVNSNVVFSAYKCYMVCHNVCQKGAKLQRCWSNMPRFTELPLSGLFSGNNTMSWKGRSFVIQLDVLMCKSISWANEFNGEKEGIPPGAGAGPLATMILS